MVVFFFSAVRTGRFFLPWPIIVLALALFVALALYLLFIVLCVCGLVIGPLPVVLCYLVLPPLLYCLVLWLWPIVPAQWPALHSVLLLPSLLAPTPILVLLYCYLVISQYNPLILLLILILS